MLQLGLLRIKSGRKTHNFHPIPQEFPEGFCGLLPFQLTGAQRGPLGKPVADMAGPRPHEPAHPGGRGQRQNRRGRRLVLGRIQQGMQAALMAPTEILATQHYHSLKELLSLPTSPWRC